MAGIIILTGTAFIVGIIVTLVSHEDEEKKYLELLPMYNCGMCGYGSCEGMAEEMVEDVLNYKKCRPLKGEKLIKLENYLKESGKL